MQEIKSILVSCHGCNGRFPAPFFAPDVRSFEAVLKGKVFATCPTCKTVVLCTATNTTCTMKDRATRPGWI